MDSGRTHALVHRFRVCWEVRPLDVVIEGRVQHAGFELELSGTHAQGVEHPLPGCDHCREVYDGLRTIAESILPAPDRPSIFGFSPFDAAIHYSPLRRSRRDVSLTIRVSHRGDPAAPTGSCQERCIADMTRSLRALGACERRWIDEHR